MAGMVSKPRAELPKLNENRGRLWQGQLRLRFELIDVSRQTDPTYLKTDITRADGHGPAARPTYRQMKGLNA